MFLLMNSGNIYNLSEVEFKLVILQGGLIMVAMILI
jgi:hypothetical protein